MIVVLIPAHNEQDCIAETIEAALDQERPADRIVVIPNGCTDITAEIARRYPVTVMELPRLSHRKSQALNMAWNEYGQEADIVITMDADTYLPPHAFRDFERELEADPRLGGTCAKFTFITPPDQGLVSNFLTRSQRYEFAVSTDISLRRGQTFVLSGPGAAFKNEVLRQVINYDGREGPWSYESTVEDYEITYRVRQAGYRCQNSPTVRGYTDPMTTLKALKGQRMKWGAGTVEDLMRFGFNRLTWHQWGQQVMALVNVFAKALLVTMWVLFIVFDARLSLLLMLSLPFLLSLLFAYHAYLVVPDRDWKDMAIAGSYLPFEAMAWIRTWWTVRIWSSVLWSKVTRRTKDRWAVQYTAEAKTPVSSHPGRR